MQDEKSFFKELFEYSHHFNQELIAVLSVQTTINTEKCTKLLSHILNAHQLWNFRIEGRENPFKPWDNHFLQDLEEIDKNNFRDSIRILEMQELNHIIEYKTGEGKVFRNRTRDILFQVINHSTYHRGQIATEFRQVGLEPLLTDFIYYKMTGH